MSLDDMFNKKEDKDKLNIYGVVVGIVTSNQDSEGLGRIKVKFPWRGEENDEKDESYWARVASLMAGNERGIHFLPEVDDEVLVVFEQGDVNHAYVIGALWNSKDKPAEVNSDGKNNIRKIKSRSGHEIIFNDDDTAMQEKIEIHTKGKHKIVLDDSSGQEKIEIVDKTGNNKIVIDSMMNSINIVSDMELKIKGKIVEIEGTTSLTLKSSAVLTIQGSVVKIN